MRQFTTKNRNTLRKLKKIATCFVAMALTVALVGCGSGSKSSDSDNKKADTATEKTQVRIAYFPNITHTQALVLKNQGTLEEKWKDTCEVSWTAFNAGPEETEALFAGEIDLGYIGPVPAVSANTKSNGDVQIISNATNAGAVLLSRKGSEIKTVADLAGKTIAVPQLGNTQHLCLLNILEENNLKTTDEGGDITVSASANADIVNLFDNGSIDAAIVPEPWGTTIENNGNAEVLLDANEIFLNGDYPTAVVVATKDFMEKHPDLVEDFLQMHEDATLYINDNQEDAQNIVNTEIQEATGKSLDADVIASAFSRMTVSTALNKDAVLSFADISKNNGFIADVPAADQLFAK